MFVELIDRLRCPSDHADTWLVAAATRTAHRYLLDATLGCPECGAEFELRDGELWFGHVDPGHSPMAVREDDAMRAAALLKLEERGLYVLDGGWGSLAAGLRDIVDVDLLLTDPPASPPAGADAATAAAAGQGTLRGIGDRWPLASSSIHGIALARATAARTADAVRVLRTGGRLVAPVDATLPPGVRELASDERHWVAEKMEHVVSLQRRR